MLYPPNRGVGHIGTIKKCSNTIFRRFPKINFVRLCVRFAWILQFCCKLEGKNTHKQYDANRTVAINLVSGKIFQSYKCRRKPSNIFMHVAMKYTRVSKVKKGKINCLFGFTNTRNIPPVCMILLKQHILHCDPISRQIWLMNFYDILLFCLENLSVTFLLDTRTRSYYICVSTRYVQKRKRSNNVSASG